MSYFPITSRSLGATLMRGIFPRKRRTVAIIANTAVILLIGLMMPAYAGAAEPSTATPQHSSISVQGNVSEALAPAGHQVQPYSSRGCTHVSLYLMECIDVNGTGVSI